MKKKSEWTIVLILFFVMMSSFSTDNEKNGPEDIGPIECREGYRAMKSFAENYGKTHNLQLIVLGRDFETYTKSIFGLWMADYSPKTLDGGRELAVDFLNTFWTD